MERRLDAIIDKAPLPADVALKQEQGGFWRKSKAFCFTPIGVAIIGFVAVLALLLLVQPAYIYKKDANDAFSLKHVNWAVVLGIAVIAAGLIAIIPYFAAKKPSV